MEECKASLDPLHDVWTYGWRITRSIPTVTIDGVKYVILDDYLYLPEDLNLTERKDSEPKEVEKSG